MIPPVPGWAWQPRHGGVRLVPSEGAAVGGIAYTERKRPLLRLRELLAERDVSARFVVNHVSAPERLVTDEGEYAAFVLVQGQLDGGPAQRPTGFVFGDDFYSLIAGL